MFSLASTIISMEFAVTIPPGVIGVIGSSPASLDAADIDGECDTDETQDDRLADHEFDGARPVEDAGVVCS